MRNVIGFTLVVIVLLFVLYLFLLLQNDYSNKAETGIDNIEGKEFFVSFSGYEADQKISIKQIDSLTAEMNLDFTIRNAVSYGVKLTDGREKD